MDTASKCGASFTFIDVLYMYVLWMKLFIMDNYPKNIILAECMRLKGQGW
jgi:hypothetical protein